MDINTLIWLLPVVFMLHDFEEIIMFERWYMKNREFILNKFPRFAPKIIKHFDSLSTSSYALVVAGEFLVFSAISFISDVYNLHYLWLGAMLAFGIHLIVHVIQFLVIRRYIPVIATSLPALAYCIYAALVFAGEENFNPAQAVIWILLCITGLAANFIIWQKLAARFEKALGKQ